MEGGDDDRPRRFKRKISPLRGLTDDEDEGESSQGQRGTRRFRTTAPPIDFDADNIMNFGVAEAGGEDAPVPAHRPAERLEGVDQFPEISVHHYGIAGGIPMGGSTGLGSAMQNAFMSISNVSPLASIQDPRQRDEDAPPQQFRPIGDAPAGGYELQDYEYPEKLKEEWEKDTKPPAE